MKEDPEVPTAEQARKIYLLGVEAAMCVKLGKFGELKRSLQRAREAGVKISDDAFDGVIARIARTN